MYIDPEGLNHMLEQPYEEQPQTLSGTEITLEVLRNPMGRLARPDWTYTHRWCLEIPRRINLKRCMQNEMYKRALKNHSVPSMYWRRLIREEYPNDPMWRNKEETSFGEATKAILN